MSLKGTIIVMMIAITMTTGGLVFVAKKRRLTITAHAARAVLPVTEGATRAVLPMTAPAHAITATKMSRFPTDGPFDGGTRTNGSTGTHPEVAPTQAHSPKPRLATAA